MPVLPHEAIVIVLDIGKSVSVLQEDEEKTFFEYSKQCVSWIIQRKLVSESSDALALVLIGCEDVSSSFAGSGYKNISCKFDFQHASWEMLKFVELDLKPTENQSDWIGAMIVSAELLKVYEEFNNVKSKKIVFFSDFNCTDSDDLDLVCENLKSSHVKMTIIGPEDILQLLDQEKPKIEPIHEEQGIDDGISNKWQREKLVSIISRKLPEQLTVCGFESALKQLCSYTRKKVRRTPWNCLLDIGDIKIRISMFKKTNPKLSNKFETKYVKSKENVASTSTKTLPSQLSDNEVAPTIRNKVMHYTQSTGQEGKFLKIKVSDEDIVEGYRYGATIIPFSEMDKAAMAYKPGEKCFSVIGFTKFLSVPFYLLSGECTYVVEPRKNDENAEVALSAIIQAMNKMQYVAIVRKVYSKDRGLSLGVLYPFIEEFEYGESEDEISCKQRLLFIELAFEQDVKSVHFPSLEKIAKDITDEQYDAVDELIDSMDLMNADRGLHGEPSEAFDLSNLHDIKEQFYHYCVVQRGLHPNKPLPKSFPIFISDYIRRPKSVDEKSKTAIRKIKELFISLKHFKRKAAKSTQGRGFPSRPCNTEATPSAENVKIITSAENLEATTSAKNVETTTSAEDVETTTSAENVETTTSAENVETTTSAENVETTTSAENLNNAPSAENMEVTEYENSEENTELKFKKLFANGFPPIEDLLVIIKNHVANLNEIETNAVIENVGEVIAEIRLKHLKNAPDVFNWWMTKFKYSFHDRSDALGQLWDYIVSGNLGLISVAENKLSSITEHEADDFLAVHGTKSLSCHTSKKKKTEFQGTPDDPDDIFVEAPREK